MFYTHRNTPQRACMRVCMFHTIVCIVYLRGACGCARAPSRRCARAIMPMRIMQRAYLSVSRCQVAARALPFTNIILSLHCTHNKNICTYNIQTCIVLYLYIIPRVCVFVFVCTCVCVRACVCHIGTTNYCCTRTAHNSNNNTIK